mmetsp:Transcript_24946/g.59276  ORF Transcript_24946/g.59276 Transcript_24946/m.59276 type:complete len:213 (+) Transcript_24946:1498-2136(+)
MKRRRTEKLSVDVVELALIRLIACRQKIFDDLVKTLFEFRMKHRSKLIVENNIPHWRDMPCRKISYQGNLRRMLWREPHKLASTFATIELRQLLSIGQFIGQHEDWASPNVSTLEIAMVRHHTGNSFEWRDASHWVRQAIIDPHSMIHCKRPKTCAIHSMSRPTERYIDQEGTSHVHNESNTPLCLAVHVLRVDTAEGLSLKLSSTVVSPFL